MMDPEVSVLLHCSVWGGLLQAQVHVELSERFNRRTEPLLESEIVEAWTARASKEPWLFNGSKFRLHSFCLASPQSVPEPPRPPAAGDGDGDRDGDGEEEDASAGHPPKPPLTLRLGLTCYRDYLGTNWSSRAAELRRLGEAEFGDPWALLAQPLGVGAVLCTRDRQVVLIRRSHRVAEAGGLLDIPGGHPEPKVVCEQLGLAVREEHIGAAMMEQAAVVSELFSSVCVEIRDEVNVPLGSLGPPVLLGVALNHTSAGRPSAEFYISCSLTSEEVRKLYWEGGAEASESTDIVFLSQREVLELEAGSGVWAELCPSAKGAVLLYQRVKPEAADDRSRATATKA